MTAPTDLRDQVAMAALRVADVLNRAADLIEPEGAWAQGSSYLSADGEWRDGGEPDVACRCIAGAINEVCRWDFSAAFSVFNVFEKHIGQDTARWNDSAYRTQAEVVAALRQAAADALLAQRALGEGGE